MDHASKAVNHAVTIGNLLIEVKSRLPHGAYTPWIEENLEVSARQARRYVDAALGKPITPRQIKSDTVAVLDFLPEPGHRLHARLYENPNDELDSSYVSVQESSRHLGYYNYLYVDGYTAVYSRRPTSPDGFSLFLTDHVIHQRYLTLTGISCRAIPATLRTSF